MMLSPTCLFRRKNTNKVVLPELIKTKSISNKFFTSLLLCGLIATGLTILPSKSYAQEDNTWDDRWYYGPGTDWSYHEFVMRMSVFNYYKSLYFNTMMTTHLGPVAPMEVPGREGTAPCYARDYDSGPQPIMGTAFSLFEKNIEVSLVQDLAADVQSDVRAVLQNINSNTVMNLEERPLGRAAVEKAEIYFLKAPLEAPRLAQAGIAAIYTTWHWRCAITIDESRINELSPIQRQTAIAHEVGHCLGLAHQRNDFRASALGEYHTMWYQLKCGSSAGAVCGIGDVFYEAINDGYRDDEWFNPESCEGQTW